MADEQSKTQPFADQIRELDGSDQDIENLWQMWQTIFPEWPIARPRLEKIVRRLPGKYYIHENGLCLCFIQDEVEGRLAVVGVLPGHRRKGLGTAFVQKAHAGLKSLVKESGDKELKSFELGSSVPRFWPQMLMSMPQEVKDFFVHSGFKKAPELGCRDLFKDIRSEVLPPGIQERVAKTNVKFCPWSPELYEECLEKQRANFSWWKAYEILAAYGQHDQVLVAIDPETNAQIGWTFMCDQSAIFADMYCFLPLLPAKEKTGLIAAVGVDPNVRAKGVGLAMVAKAMENLKARGMEGILVDSTWLRGFYEKLGLDTHWEYERYTYEGYEVVPIIGSRS